MGGRCEVHRGFWWEILKVGDHLEDAGVNGRIILKWIFKMSVGAWTRSIWLGIGRVMGSCECGAEPSGSIKSGEFLV
jgi:hypothetical protein